jgi:hypothetical protein
MLKRTKEQVIALGEQLLGRVIPEMKLSPQERLQLSRLIHKSEFCLQIGKQANGLDCGLDETLDPTNFGRVEMNVMAKIRIYLACVDKAEVHRKSRFTDWKARAPGSAESSKR